MSEVSEISEENWAVWHAFYAARRRLDRALEGQLQADSGISAADYEVLICLFSAQERRMRARDLAAKVGWEKSRISHQLTRMQARGLIQRSECEDDLRGTWVELTSTGRRTTLGAMRGHTKAIRELFFDALNSQELASLKQVSENIIGAIEAAKDSAPVPTEPC